MHSNVNTRNKIVAACSALILALSAPAWAQQSIAASGGSRPGGASGTLQYNNNGTLGGYTIGSGLAVVGSTLTGTGAGGMSTDASNAVVATARTNLGLDKTSNAFLTGGGAAAAYNAVAITGLVKGNGASAPAAYGGTSCTNQFPRSLDLNGAATCASVANADIAAATIDLTTKVTGTMPIGNGGTGAASLAGNGAVIMNSGGTAQTVVAPGSSGNVLTSNGTVWASTTPGVGGTVTAVTLAPGFSKTVGTQNTGSDQITATGTINGQLWPVNKSTSYSVAAADTGNLLIATAASVTFTAPNPAAGTKGTAYQFGSDGTRGYTLTTVGGTATFYGCSAGAGAVAPVIPVNIDIQIVDDGANYKCTAVSGDPPAATTAVAGVAKLHNVPVSVGWVATINPNNVVLAVINQASTISAIIGAVEIATGGTATVSVNKAASGTACSAGTTLHSGSFNANGTAATNQTLTVTTSSLAAGDRLCLQTTGTTTWTTGTGIGTVTVFLAPS